jgi:hypothetical protein
MNIDAIFIVDVCIRRISAGGHEARPPVDVPGQV